MRMAVTIDAQQRAKVEALGDQMTRALTLAVMQTFGECVEGTPVDTGFARGSWWLQANGSPATNPNAPSGGEGGAAPSLTSPLEAAAAVKSGLVTIANSAVYIRRLEYDGWSAQNTGWVRRAAVNFPAAVDMAIARVKAEP